MNVLARYFPLVVGISLAGKTLGLLRSKIPIQCGKDLSKITTNNHLRASGKAEEHGKKGKSLKFRVFPCVQWFKKGIPIIFVVRDLR